MKDYEASLTKEVPWFRKILNSLNSSDHWAVIHVANKPPGLFTKLDKKITISPADGYGSSIMGSAGQLTHFTLSNEL